MKSRVVITGSSGQVGGALLCLLRERFPELDLFSPGRSEMDLGDAESVRAYLRFARPQWILSSAAYTAVDAAETDRDAAFAANASAPAVMAEEAARTGAVMIHLSTDYVFPGTGDRPWVETDATGPLNVYGASKLAGEERIAATGAAHLILRTSWVYSATGKNFARTMLRLLSTKSTPLRVVDDQHGAPTSAVDLADAIVTIMERLTAIAEAGNLPLAEATNHCSGVYHCAGTGETTWAGFAASIREYLISKQGLAIPEIVPVPSSEYPTPAKRPSNSRLDCSKLQRAFGITMPCWETSLRMVLCDLTATDLPCGGFSS